MRARLTKSAGLVRVHVTVWENGGVKGAFRTATFQLRYKDQHDEWQTGHSFVGASDLKHLETPPEKPAPALITGTRPTKQIKPLDPPLSNVT
jgi:hypothetical protein